MKTNYAYWWRIRNRDRSLSLTKQWKLKNRKSRKVYQSRYHVEFEDHFKALIDAIVAKIVDIEDKRMADGWKVLDAPYR